MNPIRDAAAFARGQALGLPVGTETWDAWQKEAARLDAQADAAREPWLVEAHRPTAPVLCGPMPHATFAQADRQVVVPQHSKWDQRALSLARTLAGWSSCTRDKVGAVVMSAEHDVVATGFNDTPSGSPNCGDGGCLRAGRSCPSGSPYADDESCLHAEDNALQRAGLRARGATLYVTRLPCATCRRRAQTAGVARVVWE